MNRTAHLQKYSSEHVSEKLTDKEQERHAIIFKMNLFIANSKSSKGPTHYLGDKIEFDVPNEGHSSGISRVVIPNEGPLLETSHSVVSRFP